jgi:hypothetical protein
MNFDFSDIKPSVLNALIILATVTITVPLAKVVVNRFPIPGVTELINAI